MPGKWQEMEPQVVCEDLDGHLTTLMPFIYSRKSDHIGRNRDDENKGEGQLSSVVLGLLIRDVRDHG